MKTLKISEQEARKYYPTASDEFKAVLKTTFGKEFFNQKITDRVKSWQDVVDILEEQGEDVVLPYKVAKTKQQKSINALYKIQCIAKVLNEGWEPDFSNSNEYKYYPWFEYKKAGWSLPYVGYSFVSASSPFGCYYKTRYLVEYSSEVFIDIYKEYLP
jgi:hypothetical protein